MSSKIFMYHCDPRQNLTPESTLARINLHTLFYPKSVIQDNFLVTEHFQQVTNVSNGLFPELVRNETVTIAFREGNINSFTGLMRQIEERVKLGELRGFEDERSLELYASPSFQLYLRNLDKVTNNQVGNFVRWSPDILGRHYRKRMEEAAKNNTSGIKSDIALNVFNDVDQIAQSNKHSRSLYYDYAAKLQDADLSNKIRRWADDQYLRNLPTYHGLKISLSKKTLSDTYFHDPFKLLYEMPDRYQKLVEKNVNAIVLNEFFLANLTPDSILEIRESREFNDYIHVLDGGQDVFMYLVNYLNYLADQAPKHYGLWKNRIKKIENHKSLTKAAIIAMEVAADVLIGVTFPAPYQVLPMLSVAFFAHGIRENVERKKSPFTKEKLSLELAGRESRIDVADFSHYGGE